MTAKTLLAVVIFAGMGIIIISGACLIGKQGKVGIPVIMEPGIFVDGHFERVPNLELPINETEAKTIVKEFCESENQDSVYGYDTTKEADNEWKIQIINMSGLCYAVVNIESGKTNCEKCDDVKLFPPFEEVTITIDKTEYEQGEIIKIIFHNNLNKDIILSHCMLASCPIIQKLENNKWELGGKKLWKYQDCEFKISANDQEIYIWDQKDDNNKLLLPGIYRVNTGSIFVLGVDEKIEDDIEAYLFISNEFTIKEKTALDPRCNLKVKFSGNCESIAVGFEFDLNLGKCIVKNGNCKVETPFNTLEECQEVCEKEDMSCEQATDCIEKCPKCVDKSQLRTNCTPRFECVNGTCRCECICLSM